MLVDKTPLPFCKSSSYLTSLIMALPFLVLNCGSSLTLSISITVTASSCPTINLTNYDTKLKQSGCTRFGVLGVQNNVKIPSVFKQASQKVEE
jgi:hypothetical protein